MQRRRCTHPSACGLASSACRCMVRYWARSPTHTLFGQFVFFSRPPWSVARLSCPSPPAFPSPQLCAFFVFRSSLPDRLGAAYGIEMLPPALPIHCSSSNSNPYYCTIATFFDDTYPMHSPFPSPFDWLNLIHTVTVYVSFTPKSHIAPASNAHPASPTFLSSTRRLSSFLVRPFFLLRPARYLPGTLRYLSCSS